MHPAANPSGIHCTLIITFADGTHDEYHFPPQADAHRMKHLMDRLLAATTLCIQLEDRLIAIPVNNIRSVELLPPPDHLPELVITHARRVTPMH